MFLHVALSGALSAALLVGPTATARADRAADIALWLECLEQVDDFANRAIDHGGLKFTEKPRKVASTTTYVDFRSGYLESGRNVWNWNSESLERIGSSRDERAQLRLIRARKARWVQSRQAGFAVVTDWHPVIRLLTSREDGVPRVEAATESDGVKNFTVEHPDGLRQEVAVQPDRVSVNSLDGASPLSSVRQQWSLSSHRVVGPPNREIVTEEDMVDAEISVFVLDRIRSLRTLVRDRLKSAAHPVRVIRRMAGKEFPRMTVERIHRGVRVRVRDRYLNRSWRLTSRSGTLRVVMKDHHPPDWQPPRTAVTQAPPRTVTASGLSAFRRVMDSLIWAQRWTGLRAYIEGMQTIAFDDVTAVQAFLDSEGRPVRLYRRWRYECARIVMNKKVRRALRLVGNPNAEFSCAPGGDTDLAWAGLMRPSGWFVALLPILYTAKEAQPTVVEAKLGQTGYARYEFDGSSLTRWTVSAPLVDPDPFEVSYEYGRQVLRMPAKDVRVSESALRDAKLAPRAARLVARNARSVRSCLNSGRQNPWMCELPAYALIRQVDADTYRVYIRTRYSYDSRDVVRGVDGTYRIRRIVHRTPEVRR